MESEQQTEEVSDPEEEEEEEEQLGAKRRGSTASGQQARKRPRASVGGVSMVGAAGVLRSLGKYGPGMLSSCSGCGGGPHQASLQAPDSDLEAFLGACIQHGDKKQKLDEWLRECNSAAAPASAPWRATVFVRANTTLAACDSSHLEHHLEHQQLLHCSVWVGCDWHV